MWRRRQPAAGASSAPLTCLRAPPLLLVIHERRAHEPAGSWGGRRRGGRAGRSTLVAGQAPGCCPHCCALPDCRKEEDESREGRRALGRRVCLKSGWPSQDQLAERNSSGSWALQGTSSRSRLAWRDAAREENDGCPGVLQHLLSAAHSAPPPPPAAHHFVLADTASLPGLALIPVDAQ